MFNKFINIIFERNVLRKHFLIYKNHATNSHFNIATFFSKKFKPLNQTQRLSRIAIFSNSCFILIAELKLALPLLLRRQCINVVRVGWTQCEYVLAHRVRRGLQIFSLYTKIWDEKALRNLLNQFRRSWLARSREYMFGLLAAAVFDWEKERIPDSDLLKHSKDVEICHALRKRGNSNSCSSGPCTCQACDVPSPGNGDWDFTNDFVDLLKEEVYGQYKDVKAKDFLEVFLDTARRKEWDDHVVELTVINSDPESQSDVIYWETKWPALFTNRDYVFKRRFNIFEKEKVIIVGNKICEHPGYPAKASRVRVNEYWSYMVIKPLKDFDTPGIEFCLTYFDNPGAAIPSTVAVWVTASGMPQYLNRLRVEANRLDAKRKAVPKDDKGSTDPSVDTSPEPHGPECEVDDEDFDVELPPTGIPYATGSKDVPPNVTTAYNSIRPSIIDDELLLELLIT